MFFLHRDILNLDLKLRLKAFSAICANDGKFSESKTSTKQRVAAVASISKQPPAKCQTLRCLTVVLW